MTGIEKRKEVRIPVEFGAQIRKGASVYLGTVLNLSMNGMFVKVPALFQEGDKINVIFNIPHKSTRIEAEAEVRWKSKVENSPVFGIGLLFAGMPVEDREVLGTYISKTLMPA